MSVSRVAPGVPTGGQFAIGLRAEPQVRLNINAEPSAAEQAADAMLIGSLTEYRALSDRIVNRQSVALAARLDGDVEKEAAARAAIAHCKDLTRHTAPAVAALTADLALVSQNRGVPGVAEHEEQLRAALAEANPQGEGLFTVEVTGTSPDAETLLIWSNVAMVAAPVVNDDGTSDVRVLCLDRGDLTQEMGRVTIPGGWESLTGGVISREKVIGHLVELSEHGGVRRDVVFAQSIRRHLETEYYGGAPSQPHTYAS